MWRRKPFSYPRPATNEADQNRPGRNTTVITLETALDIAERHDEVYVAMSEDPSGGWYDLYEDQEDDDPFDTVDEGVVLILTDQDYDHEGVLDEEGLAITVLDKTTGQKWIAPENGDASANASTAAR
jgi:hypothetical protein